MKRLNPKTNLPFKHGDIREDGKVFFNYQTRIKKDGYFVESWLSKDVFNNQKQAKVKHYQENRTKILDKNRNYYFLNTDKVAKTKSQYKKNNRAKYNALNVKRELAKILRTPKWLTKEDFLQIEGFYKLAKELEAQFGEPYHVDHIVPLQGKTVSGLHVPWNLRAIQAKENLAKYNNL